MREKYTPTENHTLMYLAYFQPKLNKVSFKAYILQSQYQQETECSVPRTAVLVGRGAGARLRRLPRPAPPIIRAAGRAGGRRRRWVTRLLSFSARLVEVGGRAERRGCRRRDWSRHGIRAGWSRSGRRGWTDAAPS